MTMLRSPHPAPARPRAASRRLAGAVVELERFIAGPEPRDTPGATAWVGRLQDHLAALRDALAGQNGPAEDGAGSARAHGSRRDRRRAAESRALEHRATLLLDWIRLATGPVPPSWAHETHRDVGRLLDDVVRHLDHGLTPTYDDLWVDIGGSQ